MYLKSKKNMSCDWLQTVGVHPSLQWPAQKCAPIFFYARKTLGE